MAVAMGEDGSYFYSSHHEKNAFLVLQKAHTLQCENLVFSAMEKPKTQVKKTPR